jgi:uncharacterized protein
MRAALSRLYEASNNEVRMPASQATIPTAAASRYLQQLCKHWSHKFAVEFTPEHGTIPFDVTRLCTLDASPERLALRIEAADDATLEAHAGRCDRSPQALRVPRGVWGGAVGEGVIFFPSPRETGRGCRAKRGG